jgi:HAD superfamily hydrolase (TIGR01450 family)
VIADAYDAFLFDLDGVLYRGDRPIPGAADVVARLRAAQKRIAFVTNNSARTPGSVAAHLASVGVVATPDEIETSALTTASALSARSIRSALVVGEEGLRSALEGAGIRIVGPADGPESVVVGWDRGITYASLTDASIAIQRGAAFFASNDDPSYPAPDGVTWPGAGAIVAAISVASGTRPEVFGKPNAPILHAALERAGGGRALVIGDRIESDVAGAGAVGWDCALVLTGIASREDLAASGFRATFVLDDLSGLLED